MFLYEIQNCFFHMFSQQWYQSGLQSHVCITCWVSFRIKENCFHGFENSVVIFLHSLVLELLSDETDIDVMMLFKFDFNHAVLNFKIIASMKSSFDLNLIFLWSRDCVLFKWNVKKGYQKNLKKFQFHESRLIKNFFWLIKQESRIDWFRQKLRDEFLQIFNQSRIPFDRSNVLFDQSNKNWESIESSRDFVMNFFSFSIDWEILSTNQTYCFWNFTKC